MNALHEVLTSAEAAKTWGLSDVTVRHACSGYSKEKPKFTAEECRQSGRTWLITRAGMSRVFDPQP